MSEPFLAEVRMVGFNFAPRGWAFCDGQILPINQNQSLYSLLGTTYGGDGRTTFALPDLRSRSPMHRGSGHVLGQKSGFETVTLSQAEMPNHNHVLRGRDTAATGFSPADNELANVDAAFDDVYAPSGGNVNMASGTIANVGGGQAHNNMQPYLALNFCIALQGLFPSRN